jgi:hypothetical protein
MIPSIYEALKTSFKKPLFEIITKLKQHNITLFEPLYIPNAKEDAEEAFKGQEAAFIIFYILFAYSQDSDFLIMGIDSLEEKKAIAEFVGLPEYLYAQVVNLKSSVVRGVALSYLDKQGSREFRHLQLMKDMYEQALSSLFSEATVDIKSMSEVRKITESLLKDIQEYENKLRSEYKFIYDNKEELFNIDRVKAVNDNGNIENSKWVR